MKLIVGLGNPGMEYLWTPHNAGFMAIDHLAAICDVAVTNFRGKAMTARTRLMGMDVLLAKPATFMNLSGQSVKALLDEMGLGVQDLVVLYDELAIPLGQIRVRPGGSAGGHNGVKSITGVLGTEEWTRVRIGVGKPPAETGREVKAGGTGYLLSPMRKAELAVLQEALEEAVRAVEVILTDGVSEAMSRFNRKVQGKEQGVGNRE